MVQRLRIGRLPFLFTAMVAMVAVLAGMGSVRSWTSICSLISMDSLSSVGILLLAISVIPTNSLPEEERRYENGHTTMNEVSYLDEIAEKVSHRRDQRQSNDGGNRQTVIWRPDPEDNEDPGLLVIENIGGKPPTSRPTRNPTRNPRTKPTMRPTRIPTRIPTRRPSPRPSRKPTSRPSRRPTNRPSSSNARPPQTSPTNRPSPRPSSSNARPPTEAAAEPAGPEKIVSFIAMADVPYQTLHRYCLNTQLREIDQEKEDFLFMIHLGDIKSGQTRYCEETYYSDVAEIFSNERNALNYDPRDVFFIIGDNEWIDCDSPSRALSYWMNHFGNGGKTNGYNTGRNPYGFGTMSDPEVSVEWDEWDNGNSIYYPSSASNFAIFYKGVLFVGINQVGGSSVGDESTRVRNNFNWVRGKLSKYANEGLRTLVVFAHAKMSGARWYYFGEPFRRLLRETYPNIAVLYLHGDGHEFAVQRPDALNTYLVDLELFSGEWADPVKITINRDPSSSFDRFVLDRRGGPYPNGVCVPDNRDKTWSSNSW